MFCQDRVVLSNMPEIDCQDDASDPSLKVVKFGTSPIMSTYLVAITVGEFDYIEDKSEEGILCRVYSLLGKKEQGAVRPGVCRQVSHFLLQVLQCALSSGEVRHGRCPRSYHSHGELGAGAVQVG